MSLFQSFQLTPNVMDMVNQFSCESDLERTIDGAKLCSSAALSVYKDFEKFRSGELQTIFEKASEELQEKLTSIIRYRYGLDLLAFNLRKDQDHEGRILYSAEIMADSDNVITINITQLGIDPSNDFSLFLKEKPSLCWIADSRSPFYIEGFSEKISDISAVTLLLVKLDDDSGPIKEMLLELGESLIPTLN